MERTRVDIMGMPITVEVVGGSEEVIESVFTHFSQVDERFSTYKEASEISRLNRGELALSECSPAMREIFELAERTKHETSGYFDIERPEGGIDPSGAVKGWAIEGAAQLLRDAGYVNFMINAAGDIATSGANTEGNEWSVGIRNPFKREEIVKVVYPRGKGIATSGSYIRGAHIYDPHAPGNVLEDIVSLTVIASDALQADLYATAAFAMGTAGIAYLEARPGFEGYAIDKDGIAIMTSGFLSYV